MDEQRLWAPWRLEYISRGGDESETPAENSLDESPRFAPGADPECFLCRSAAESQDSLSRDRKNLVVHRGKHIVTLLNRYPYNNGHLLVAPRRHEGRLDKLSEAEWLEMHQVMATMIGHIERMMGAEGFNMGLNLGRAAGAGVPDHLHWHIVPRWAGDVNFITSVAGTRVIPQALDALWELLGDALSNESRDMSR